MAWSLVLCELDTVALAGAQLGRIENAYERKLTFGINGLALVEAQMRLGDPRGKEIMDREGDVLLKVYDGSTLKAVLECIAAEESWDAENNRPRVACVFSGPFWRLIKRLTGTVATGEGGTPSAARGQIADDMVTEANGRKDTGIRIGTIASLRTATMGTWRFKPVAEGFSDLAESFAPPSFETVMTSTTLDIFNTGAPGSALAGRTSTSSHTWNSAGAATDFTLDTTGVYMSRVVGNDGATDGRHGILGTSHPTAGVLVQAEIFRDGTMGSPATLMGIMARYVNATNYLRLTVTTNATGSQVFRLTKMVAGVSTDIWVSAAGTILDPSPFAGGMRLVVDATGRWAIWWWPLADLSYQANPIMMGYDSDLDAGGPLDGATNPGACGIYNYSGGTGSPVQGWENYGTATPANSLDPEALEFELAPTEPTPDTGQDGVVGAGVQIATLNVATRLGTDRPDVIFEQGDGTRTMKGYKRAISKDAQMNRGFVLPTDDTPWPAGTLIEREDAASILARGLFEDVVSTDAGAARGAVLDLHLFFRKQARQVITFDPSAAARYVYGTDYEEGDTVTARAKFQGIERFNGLFRIEKVEITLDDEGAATVSPILARD